MLDTGHTDFAKLPHPGVVDCMCGCMMFERVDDVLTTALKIHGMLEDMYRQRACAAAIADEVALFTALAAGHNAEVRRVVRDMARLDAY